MNGIVGVGPVGLLVAALLERAQDQYTFLVRNQSRAEELGRLMDSGIPIRAETAGRELDGDFIRGQVGVLGSQVSFERVFLCTPHTEFESAISGLDLSKTREIVLLNSGLCSSTLLTRFCPGHVLIRSFSNFFAAAKMDGQVLHLKALKKRVYLSEGQSFGLLSQLEALGVEVRSVKTALEAELRNITLYAHTIFGLAPFTLEWVFGLTDAPRYLYKLFPEGPVERRRTLLYATFFEDVMQ